MAQPLKVISALPDKKPQLSISKEGIAGGTMLVGTALAGIGAGAAWGPGVGVFVAGILLFVCGILLGIG